MSIYSVWDVHLNTNTMNWGGREWIVDGERGRDTVTIIDYDDDYGSKVEEFDKAIIEAKKRGQEEISYYLEHCRPDNVEV